MGPLSQDLREKDPDGMLWTGCGTCPGGGRVEPQGARGRYDPVASPALPEELLIPRATLGQQRKEGSTSYFIG